MRAAVVMTTIRQPQNLDAITSQLTDDDVLVIVKDRKTPWIEYSGDRNVVFMGIDEQVRYLGDPCGIPFDTIPRRNVGYLYAIKECNPEVIISVDDDNMMGDWWISDHSRIIGDGSFQCGYLPPIVGTAGGIDIAHRGSLSLSLADQRKSSKVDMVLVNEGLVIRGDPDVDARDRCARGEVEAHGRDCTTSSGRYYPFNSQNTSFARRIFPAMCLIHNVGRYDDIWMSFVMTRIIRRIEGAGVRWAGPNVTSKRNEHDLKQDLLDESFGMAYSQQFVDALDAIDLYSSDVLTNVCEIADGLQRQGAFPQVSQSLRWWVRELLR